VCTAPVVWLPTRLVCHTERDMRGQGCESQGLMRGSKYDEDVRGHFARISLTAS